MYQIIDVNTQEVLRDVESPPTSIGNNEFVVQVMKVAVPLVDAIAKVNTSAERKISDGYTYTNGVLFGLSITDQLNYNSVASILNMGAESVTLFGELNGEKYYSVVMDAAAAALFFSSLFAYVDNILGEHRAVKKLLTEASVEDIEQILLDAGIEE